MYRLIRMMCVGSCLCFSAMLVFVALPGCNKGTEVAKGKTDKTSEKDKEGEHLDFGPHGGPCAEWGKEDYHAEFIVDAEKKQVTVYILGSDPLKAPKAGTKVTDVELIIKGTKPLVTLKLMHDPKESGDKGIAFRATHDAFAKPDGMDVSISGNVGGVPYTNDVLYKAPKKSSSSLYRTPGGIYTVADIKANGGQTAADKYAGKTWAHDDNLVKGDRICPVTKNKADPECSWIIQGQTYQFCCHPCVDKFVRQAHDDKDSKTIKNANEYIFKGM